MTSFLKRFGLLLGISMLALVAVAAPQDMAAIRQAAQAYALQQTAGLPGQVSVTLGNVDAMQLAECAKLQAFLPPGGKLWGNASVGVRCASGAGWSVYVPVTVRVQAPIVVAARPLSGGKTLTEDDISVQTGELTQLPMGVVSDPKEAVGKVISTGINAGYPLRQDMLRGAIVIRQGQSVRLVAQGQGFKVSSEGKALNNAAVGQIVQVKAQNGQTVSGTVRADGMVEVMY